MDLILDRIKNVIAFHFGKLGRPINIDINDNILSFYNGDELDRVEFAMALEEEFKIAIEEEDIYSDKLATINNIITFLDFHGIRDNETKNNSYYELAEMAFKIKKTSQETINMVDRILELITKDKGIR